MLYLVHTAKRVGFKLLIREIILHQICVLTNSLRMGAIEIQFEKNLTRRSEKSQALKTLRRIPKIIQAFRIQRRSWREFVPHSFWCVTWATFEAVNSSEVPWPFLACYYQDKNLLENWVPPCFSSNVHGSLLIGPEDSPCCLLGSFTRSPSSESGTVPALCRSQISLAHPKHIPQSRHLGRNTGLEVAEDPDFSMSFIMSSRESS